jgi:Cu+-exporting ATPase
LNFFQSIEGMLRSQPGIHSVKVALLAERGVVEFDPMQWTTEKVINVSFPSVLSESGA